MLSTNKFPDKITNLYTVKLD